MGNVVGEDEDPTVKSTMAANTIDKGHDHLRPGEQYTIYHTQDILGSLPTDLELVVSRAAKWAGVDDDYVAAVVERLERRVLKWWDRQQRKERTTTREPEQPETFVWVLKGRVTQRMRKLGNQARQEAKCWKTTSS